jgi:hypothetical protein
MNRTRKSWGFTEKKAQSKFKKRQESAPPEEDPLVDFGSLCASPQCYTYISALYNGVIDKNRTTVQPKLTM